MSFAALLESDFKTDPWDHQLREFEVSADLPARALLWQMRTGKSKQIADTASSMFRRGLIDAVCIFAPNGVHENWIVREFPTHVWDSVDWTGFSWKTRIGGAKGGRGKSKVALALWEDIHRMWHDEVMGSMKLPGLKVYAFNSESVIRPDVRKIIRHLLAKRRVLCVWDESSDYRSPGSARSKMARSIALRVPARRILDGTVITNSPLASFAQFELLQKGALGFTKNADFESYFAEFENVTRGGRTYPKLVGFKHLDVLRERMGKWSSVVTREDCEDLPPIIPSRRKIQMSPEQVRIYREVEKQIRIEIDRGEVVTIDAKTVRLGKLQQVAGGFIINEHGKVLPIPGPNPRMDAVADEVYWAGGRVIVWAQYRHEIEAIAARLREEGQEVWTYYGGTKDDEKKRIRREFPLLDRKVTLAAQCQSAGRGIELPADLMVWYSHTFSGIFRKQATERATVMGGNVINLVDFLSAGVDHYILDTVAGRIEIADDVAGRGLQEILNRYTITEDSDDY
jgi:hypothetical protein